MGAQPVKYLTEVEGARRPGASTVLLARHLRWLTDHVAAAVPMPTPETALDAYIHTERLFSESAKKAEGLLEI
jgi:hypothetical protein